QFRAVLTHPTRTLDHAVASDPPPPLCPRPRCARRRRRARLLRAAAGFEHVEPHALQPLGRSPMAQISYAAMLEQFHPKELVGFCEQAEAAGFSGVMAADHLQPWTPQQGNAAFVWAFMVAAG